MKTVDGRNRLAAILTFGDHRYVGLGLEQKAYFLPGETLIVRDNHSNHLPRSTARRLQRHRIWQHHHEAPPRCLIDVEDSESFHASSLYMEYGWAFVPGTDAFVPALWNAYQVVRIIPEIVMSSINYSRPEPQISMVEVVKAAALELRRLRARHRAVTKRIRQLRIAVGALRGLKRDGMRHAEGVDGGNSNPTAVLQEWNIRAQSRDLRRACRIALLETIDAVTYTEIYARIVRRGSFLFDSPALAVAAIIEELNAMADAGEVRCVDASAEQRWQRISPSDDEH
jgi:hypothetical protein